MATGQPKVRCWLVGIFIATLCTAFSNARVIEETGMFGELMSPGYPDTYPNNEDIQWNITVPKGYQIRLYFTLFDVEYAADCEYDFLKIKSGDRDIGKYCGTKEIMAESTPSDVILTSYPDNHVTVYFHSDFSNDKPFKGFVAHYYADDIDECATNNGGCDHACHNYETGYFCTCRMGFDLMDDQHQCIAACRDIEYTSTSGVLQSIDYPEVYPNNANCDWTINVESGYVIHFEFDFIDVESHPTVDCPYDFIMVEADGIRHGPYCGNHPETPLPPQIVTSGHELQVIFHSDGSVNQHGFQASYYVTAKPCVDIGPPTYGFMKGENFTFKESVQFSCKPGYNLVGSEIRTCMADGSWSGSEARCDLVDCGEPKPLLNGHILLYNRYNFTYTNDVGFKCDSLYDLIGPSFRTCGVDGRWSFDEPICVPKCGKSIVSPNQPQRSRIHGGHDVAQGSWPWQVLLHIHAQEQEFERAGKICGGSLINEEWVMTAAHCVTGGNSLHRSHFGQPIPEDSIRLVLGLHHRDNEDENTLSVHTSRIIVHPDYTAANYDADIALVQLNETVTLTQNIRPLCLPPQNPNANTTVGDEDTRVDIDNAGDSNQGVVIGWGQTTTSAISDVLKEVYVPVIDRHTCRESTDHDVTRNMVCAGVGGRDSCQGDSGGPLMLRNSTDLRFYAYGIVSWGDECGSADTYGVYTRVENYVDWVLQNSFIDRTNN